MKIKLVLAVVLCLVMFQACASKNSTQTMGAYDELFEDDGKFVPINSAEIQRKIEQAR